MHETVDPGAPTPADPLPPAAPPPGSAPEPAALPTGEDWQALPSEAGTLMMLGGLLFALLLCLPATFAFGWRALTRWLDFDWPAALGLLALAWLAAAALGAWLGWRRWKASAWKLDDTGLHLRRGRAWRKEILVPRSRVQHLDIERGPIERNFGLATLVIHTAGTRQHAIRQPGLVDADAVALRDALVPASAGHDDVL